MNATQNHLIAVINIMLDNREKQMSAEIDTAYVKICRIIKSCETPVQLRTAHNCVGIFERRFPREKIKAFMLYHRSDEHKCARALSFPENN